MVQCNLPRVVRNYRRLKKWTNCTIIMIMILFVLPPSSLSFVPQPSIQISIMSLSHGRPSFSLSPLQIEGNGEKSLPNEKVMKENSINTEIAEKQLFQKIQEYKDATSGKEGIDSVNINSKRPSVDFFTSLIDEYLAFPFPEKAEFILDKMEEFYTPSGRLYERLINAWCFEGVEITTTGNFGNDQQQYNDIDDKNVLEQADEDASKMGLVKAQNAARVLDRMEGLHQEIGDLDFRPALSTYTSVINALLRTSKGVTDNDNATVTEMVERIRKKRDSIYTLPELTRISLSSDQNVFDILKNLDNGEESFRKLRKKKSYQKNKRPVPIATTANFNHILNELAKQKKLWASQAAEDILDYMVECYEEQSRLKPNIKTFNACINAWAQCPMQSDSALRAKAILEKLNVLQTVKGLLLDVTPNNVSYNSIIKAHANLGEGDQAEAVLTLMEDFYKTSNNEEIKPDLVSFSTVLNAYAKIAPYESGAERKAEDLLTRMIKEYKNKVDENGREISYSVQPNVWCFNAVLNCHAARGSGNRALLLLNAMEEMAEKDKIEAVRPDTYTYNTVLKALANSRERGSIDRARQILDKMESDKIVKPDSITYNTVILGCANNGGKYAGRTAELILRQMEVRFKKGDKFVKPDASTYTSVIKAWMFSEDKGRFRRVEEIVSALEQPSDSDIVPVEPHTTIYNALLDCWAKSPRPVAGKAERVLKHMEQSYSINGNKHLKPNIYTYTTVIDILSKSRGKGCERALEILNLIEDRYKAGEMSVRPNVYTYTAVINCFARSNKEDKAVKAMSILRRMEEEYRSGNKGARPNEIAYNNVLNACAYTLFGDAKAIETAFKIACITFDEIRSSDYLVPTHVTYGTYLSVCGNLMPESKSREKLVEAVFKRCVRKGLCSKMVLRNLKGAASSKLLDELLGGVVDEGDLPLHWNCNV